METSRRGRRRAPAASSGREDSRKARYPASRLPAGIRARVASDEILRGPP
jgi:hypothetical protein